MLADQPQFNPAIGEPDATILDAGAFRQAIVVFIERELPIWRDRPDRPNLDDEPHLNELLCGHLNSASRRQSFDLIQFMNEPVQSAGRRGDIAVKPQGTIRVEGRNYTDFEQLLPIECKRLPTPPGSHRSDLEYVAGVPGHRTGGIERFKHGLHGVENDHALMIAYVQAETLDHWFGAINQRLDELASNGAAGGLWRPTEALSCEHSVNPATVGRYQSQHRRHSPPATSGQVVMQHLWLMMN